MNNFDYVVLALYLAGTLALGGFFYFRNKTAKDMFSASGQSPWWVSGLSSFMTMFSAATFVVWGSIAYEYGIVAISINIGYGVAALAVGYFVAGRWKTIGVSSAAEYMALRFGAAVVHFYTWVLMAFRLTGSAVALYGLSVLLSALMPLPDGHLLQDPQTGNMSVQAAILIFGSVVVLYTMAGGLWAVLMTDVIQFIVLTLAVVFVVPLILLNVGGFQGFASRAPDGFFNLVAGEYTWFFLAGWSLVTFFMIGADWAFVQRFVSVRTAKDARKGTYLFGVLYLISPFLWLTPPLVYRVIDPNANPEQAYILASKLVLPAGMVGLMVAAMFSATASLISSQLNVFAGALTETFYASRFSGEANERRLIWVGRGFATLLGALIIILAIQIPTIGGAASVILAATSLIVGPLLAPALAGLFSKTLSVRSIWLVFIVAVGVALILKFLLPSIGDTSSVGWLQSAAKWAQDSHRAVDLIVGVVVPILVVGLSILFTRSENPGWGRIQALSITRSTDAVLGQQDGTPARIVVIALLGIGVCFLIIAHLSPDSQFVIRLFGLTVMLIAGIIYAFIRLNRSSAALKNSH